MNYIEIDKEINSGAPDAAIPILLCGEERFLVEHYEKRLTALFGGGAVNKLDISVFYGEEQSDDMVMGALDTLPMLSPARVVVVRNHAGISGAGAGSFEALAKYIARMPETARLIFSSGHVNKTRALYKAIAKCGKVYEFTRLSEKELAQFALKRFRAKGVKISPDSLDAFGFATGYLEKDTERDLFSVENDALKIAAFVLSGGRDVVTDADIAECLPGVLRPDLFAMLDAISSGRKGEAIRLLESGLAGGESVFRLLSTLIGQFEIMLGYQELAADGKRSAEITQILGERSEWRVKKLGGFAGHFSAGKLQKILGRLYGLERDIKSGDISDKLALTVLFAEI